jgi:hypothetical protein
MPAKKINKSAFVRGLPSTMPAAEVVKTAAAKGIKLGEKFVHTIRYNAKKSAAKKSGGSVGKRGPGRPRMDNGGVGNGLEAAIEHIVEAKVNALLSQKLGALFGQ